MTEMGYIMLVAIIALYGGYYMFFICIPDIKDYLEIRKLRKWAEAKRALNDSKNK